MYAANVVSSGQSWNWGDFAVAAGTGAVAGSLIAASAVAVAAGAISATMATVGTGAGVGMAAGGGSYMVANTVTGSEFNGGDMLISASVGGATGALGPVVGTSTTGAVLLNATSGAAQYELTYYHHNKNLDWDEDVLWAAGASAGTTALTGAYKPSSSYYGNMKPTVPGSGSYWQQLDGWSTRYPSAVRNPYAAAHLAGNLASQGVKDVGPVAAVNAGFSTISQRLKRLLED